MPSQYNEAITYMKAFAILAMVLGHASGGMMIERFVGQFHMPIFFFAAGYCFKPKYFNIPWQFVRKRLSGLWIPYVKWGVLLVIMHNIFFDLNIYNDEYGFMGMTDHRYSVQEIISKLAMVLYFGHNEGMLGGYWFLKSFFYSSIISIVLLLITRKYNKQVIWALATTSMILIVSNRLSFTLPVLAIRSQEWAASFLFLAGYAWSYYNIQIFKLWQCFLCFVLLVIGYNLWPNYMGSLFFSNKYIFQYLITASLASWAFYSVFSRIRNHNFFLLKVVKHIGNNTLTILTWHFLSFKLVSLCIIKMYNLPIGRLAEFPVIKEYSHEGWWIVYFIIATVVTCSIAYTNKWIKHPYLKL